MLIYHFNELDLMDPRRLYFMRNFKYQLWDLKLWLNSMKEKKVMMI